VKSAARFDLSASSAAELATRMTRRAAHAPWLVLERSPRRPAQLENDPLWLPALAGMTFCGFSRAERYCLLAVLLALVSKS
jgi:hypothetical protein